VTVTTDNGHTIINPADMVYEIPEGGGLRYKFAKCCYGRETSDVDEYRILCWEGKEGVRAWRRKTDTRLFR
jgi:hypothetical protein